MGSLIPRFRRARVNSSLKLCGVIEPKRKGQDFRDGHIKFSGYFFSQRDLRQHFDHRWVGMQWHLIFFCQADDFFGLISPPFGSDVGGCFSIVFEGNSQVG